MIEVPNFRLLFEQGFNAIEARDREEGGWHATQFNDEGIPYVHASQVGGCPRQYVLSAANYATDGMTVDSAMNITFGKALHKILENTFALVPDLQGWKCMASELGFTHSKMLLKGQPDAILVTPMGQPVLFDLKTEAGQSKKMRYKAAEQSGADHTARPEHVIQVTAGAMLAEDAGFVSEAITVGMVTYVSRQIGKNKWDMETVLFEITSALRATVAREVLHKVNAWKRYHETGELPLRLPQIRWFGKMTEPWQCRPRGDDDQRGEFCEARFTCFNRCDDTRVIA